MLVIGLTYIMHAVKNCCRSFENNEILRNISAFANGDLVQMCFRSISFDLNCFSRNCIFSVSSGKT